MNRNLHIINIVLFALVVGFISGCSSSSETTQAPRDRHFLWEVSGHNSTLYLAGSIHLLKENVYPLPAAFDSTFGLSNRLVMEMGLDSLDMASVTQLLLAKGMFTDGTTLQEALPDSVYRMAKAKLSELGMDIAVMSRFRPWFVMFTISAVEMQQSGFEAQHGLDMYFLKQAQNRGVQVDGLETLEEQVRAFEGISDGAQVDVLYQALVEDVPIGEEMDRLLQAWQSGDTLKVENYMMKEFEGNPETLDALLTKRNKRWISSIERYLVPGTSAYIVVGAAHLLGKDGLLEMLRNRGYRVRQL